MTASNLLAWSLQIGVLVLVAALASSVLQLRIPRARLFHWQMVLMASLARCRFCGLGSKKASPIRFR